MKEPAGFLERLHDKCPTSDDLAFVEHQLGVTTNQTELKVLQRLKERIVALSTHGRSHA